MARTNTRLRCNDDRVNVSGQMSLSPPFLTLASPRESNVSLATLWTNKTTAVSSSGWAGGGEGGRIGESGFPIGDLCIFLVQNRCSDWRCFGVLRLLIYDKAGRGRGKSEKLGWMQQSIITIRRQASNFCLHCGMVWCQETAKMNGCGGLWLPPCPTCNFGQRNWANGTATWSCFSETQIPMEPRGPGLCRMCRDNFIRRKTFWQKQDVLQ